MKRIFKNLIICVVFILLMFVFSGKVNASNKIEKIEMDVYINSNGVAEVTEKWQATLTKGTEGYKPYSNLEDSEIINFSVTDDTGSKYTCLSTWNTNGSFSEKAYKCGINKTNKGVELCWGISQYGARTYTLKYEITNFINQYNDSQGIYFSFMPKEMKQSPSSAIITIHSDKKFTEKDSKIWAFGYKDGTINFKNGKIVMDSKGKLASSSYMTALIKIENNIFNTDNKVNRDFNSIYEEAMQDVPKEEKSNTQSSEISDIEITPGKFLLGLILMIVFNPLFWVFLIVIIVSIKRGKTDNKYISGLDFGVEGKQLPEEKDIQYYRNVPCKKDIYRAYWILEKYNIEGKKNSLIGAIFLTWIKDGKAVITKTRKGLFDFKDNNYAIDLRKIVTGSNEVENELLSTLKKASGTNGILEAKEFEKWCIKNYYYIDNWMEKVIDYETKMLEQEGKIKVEETIEENTGLIRGTHKVVNRYVDKSMKQEAVELIGLKKFLLDYSMIDQRQAIEVALWEDYLIYAQLLGIAEKVEEQFSKLYPEYNKKSNINIEYTTIYTRQMVDRALEASRRGREKYEERERRRERLSYSRGRGGKSHSKGGRSAKGSSSGGGFR